MSVSKYFFQLTREPEFHESESSSTYHTMPRELRIRAENAVSRGVISRSIHSIGASLIEGRLLNL